MYGQRRPQDPFHAGGGQGVGDDVVLLVHVPVELVAADDAGRPSADPGIGCGTSSHWHEIMIATVTSPIDGGEREPLGEVVAPVRLVGRRHR